MRRWLHYSLVTVAAWLGFFALIGILPAFSGVFTWEQAFRMTFNHWLPWMLLSPVIVWFTLLYPIEWAGWHRRVSAHLVVGILSVGTCTWLGEYTSDPPMRPLFEGTHGETRFDRGPLPPPHGGPDQDQHGPPGDLDRADQPPGPHPMDGNRHGPPLWLRAGFNIPIYLTIASLCHAFVYFRRTQQRDRHALELETQLGQARLQALRMQLQPHFLFNTLNAISTLVQTNPAAAQEMIGSLGQMLRLSLDSGSEPEVPLEQELKFLNCYLEIAQTRFGDRLAVTYDLGPETVNALVPTFILQPLVENAVRHGIEPAAAGGTIEISVRHDGQMLLILIRDTGVGLAAEPSGPGGIGIANTRARLASLYPGWHHFEVRNSAAGGCVAELEIPFHTEPLARTEPLATS